jgi:hypothetical protein
MIQFYQKLFRAAFQAVSLTFALKIK